MSRTELSALARSLQTGTGAIDRYTAIHILGLMRATEHEQLVASFLHCPNDPMLARISLQVLCSYWNMADRYRDQIQRFIRGEEWDKDSDVKLVALSMAGEMLRASPDDKLTRLIASVFESRTESHIVRQAAYFAIARAYGRGWNQLPPASRQLDLETGTDPEILRWLREKAGMETS